jgi:hypothetical protein
MLGKFRFFEQQTLDYVKIVYTNVLQLDVGLRHHQTYLVQNKVLITQSTLPDFFDLSMFLYGLPCIHC